MTTLRERQAPLKAQYEADPESAKLVMSVRSATSGDDPTRCTVATVGTPGGNGVVDIQALERALAPLPNAGAADRLNSAEYALHLIQFPYRQVFGEPREAPVREVFRPTIAYAALADRVFRMGGQ